jgi:GAF domain-containing protein
VNEPNAERGQTVEQLARELAEAREQQTATSAILRVIATSPTDIGPVLQQVAESAARYCDTDDAAIFLERDGMLDTVAHFGPIRLDLEPQPISRDWVTGRAFVDHATVEVDDLLIAGDFPRGQQMANQFGHRATVATPLLRDDEAIGALVIRRTEVRPFSEKQVTLLKTFADQAAIAIQNVRLFEQVRAKTAELSESLAQQTATADVLKVISRSAFDLQTVLDTLVQSAARLCRADKGCLERLTDSGFQYLAVHGFPPGFRAYADAHQTEFGRGSAVGRAAQERQIIHIADIFEDPEYTYGAIAQVGGMRTVLAVPLLREDKLIGVFAMIRAQVRPFEAKEIELVKTFADQAAIAIENVRLFDEVQARTAELTESLQQQTATADVLKVISRSAFDLDSVLQTLIQSATALCEADASAIYMLDGDVYRLSASVGASAEFLAYERDHPNRVGRDSFVGRTALEKKAVHVADAYADAEHASPEAHELGGYRATLCVPLMREGAVIGVFALSRQKAGYYTPRQVELVESFADQAVIAIENVRLFQEVQSRTAELSESLQQQTATADVLKVISRSAFDLQAVFQVLIESAVRLCAADRGTITIREADVLRAVAEVGLTPEHQAYERAHPHPVGRGTFHGRAVVAGETIHVPDVMLDPEYERRDVAIAGNFRAVIAVPIRRGDEVIGVFGLGRAAPGPFAVRQIELVETFADQAAIAIENVRLFDEVQAKTAELSESLEQQTATADVLKVISRSTFDLKSVLQTLIDSATNLCRAEKGGIYMLDGDSYRLAAQSGMSAELIAHEIANPNRAGRDSYVGRAVLEKRVVHVADVSKDFEYGNPELPKIGRFASVVSVPLLREGTPIGVFSMARSAPESFTDRQVELVQTFADQAVIAIENVRLFEETQDRTRELTRSLEELRTAQDRLVQTEKLASLGQLTAGIAHEIKNPLNFINNFSTLSADLVDELLDTLAPAALEPGTRAAVDEITGLLKGNLDKVVQHGRRADSIVKNMLMHSREGSGEHRPTSINAVVEESLNLAYHGARAERKDFNVTLEKAFDPAAGQVDLYPQEISRVLLNLLSNSFHATTRRQQQANGAYEPKVIATTKDLGDRVEIRIRDNGTGITPEVREKMFNPFFTTKPAGEGTGLGLSLSHDIVSKQHAGSIEVDTEPGQFTEFRIVLPRRAAALGKTGGKA